MKIQNIVGILPICKIILILFTISILITLVVFLTSSEAIESCRSPEINPYVIFNVSPQSNEVIYSASHMKEIKQSIKDFEDNEHNNFIGIIKDGNYSIILKDDGDMIIESVYGLGGTWQYDLTPECLGKTHLELSPQTTDAVAGIALYRIKLELPDEANNLKPKYVDLYDVWCENKWCLWKSNNLLHTEGRFYVNYGQNVVYVIDKSYSVTSPGFLRYHDHKSEIFIKIVILFAVMH